MSLPDQLSDVSKAVTVFELPYRPKFAVYFLIAGDSVCYVGSSKNLMGRIGAHTSDKAFDRVAFLEFDSAKEMLEAERHWIRRLQPALNFTHTSFRPNMPDRSISVAIGMYRHLKDRISSGVIDLRDTVLSIEPVVGRTPVKWLCFAGIETLAEARSLSLGELMCLRYIGPEKAKAIFNACRNGGMQ